MLKRFFVLAATTCMLNGAALAGDSKCPPLKPVDDGAASNNELVLAEIDPGDNITLYNNTDSDIDLGTANYWLCSRPQYSDLRVHAPGVVVPARGYASIPMPGSFTDVDSGGEIVLYRDIESFANFGIPDRIVDFTCWGTNPHLSRASQAMAAGKWDGEGCNAALVNGALRRLASTDGTTAAHYADMAPTGGLDCTPAPVPQDLNGDGIVDSIDLLALLGNWGNCDKPCPPSCEGDFNGDCQVDTVDLLELLGAWG